MARFKLTIEYDGTPFVGWQRQGNLPSVQLALESAIKKFSGEEVVVYGAGRTDAGVHALGQVAHVDLAKDWPPETVRNALNFHVQPDPVIILAAAREVDDFHARLSATSRAYLYRILNRSAPPAVERNRVWHVHYDLDAAAMHEAAQSLIGHHDFSTFRATFCQAKTPMKTLDRLDVSRVGDEVHVQARARSFLHHQVRNMVGTLKLVGQGKWAVRDVADALAARDRTKGGPTAPPDGLYLVSVTY